MSASRSSSPAGRGEEDRAAAAARPRCAPRRPPPACCRGTPSTAGVRNLRRGLRVAQRQLGEARPAPRWRVAPPTPPSEGRSARAGRWSRRHSDPGVPRSCSAARAQLLRLVPHARRACPSAPTSVPSRGRTSGARSSQPGKVSSASGARPPRPASSRSLASSPGDFGYSISGSSVQSSTLSTERWVSTSNRRIDSTWSPKNSMRTGLGDSGEKTSRMPPRTEYSPTISTGSRRCIADALEVRHHVVERDLLPRPQGQRELAVEIGVSGSEQRRRDRRHGDGHALGGQPPQRDGPLLADLACAATGAGGAARPAPAAAAAGSRPGPTPAGRRRSRSASAQRLGLLLALDHHQQRPLGELPEQHRCRAPWRWRSGRRGSAGGAVLVLEPAHQFLERRVAPQALEQIANRGVGQGWSRSAGRFRISSTIPVVE